jgi:hypothetical protein
MPITYPQVYHPQQYQRPLGGVYNLASMYLAGKTAAAQADIARGRNAVNMANAQTAQIQAGTARTNAELAELKYNREIREADATKLRNQKLTEYLGQGKANSPEYWMRAAQIVAEDAQSISTAGQLKEPEPLKATDIAGMRKEWTGLNKDFRSTVAAYQRVKASAGDPSAAGDLALIFNYMKILDPNSVVRESEFRSAEQAKAWLSKTDDLGIPIPSAVRTMIQKAKPGQKGAFLLPEQREDFVSRAEKLYASQTGQYEKRKAQFEDLAKRNKVDPRDVVIDFLPPEGETTIGRFKVKAK